MQPAQRIPIYSRGTEVRIYYTLDGITGRVTSILADHSMVIRLHGEVAQAIAQSVVQNLYGKKLPRWLQIENEPPV